MYEGDDFQHISLDDMMLRIRERVPEAFDMVVAVGRGGLLPGYLAARFLDVPLESVSVRFRDDSHRPLYPEPRVESAPTFDSAGKRILLTDDVSNSGATLRKAAALLAGAKVTTLVISGNADISLYGPHERCIRWPWDRADERVDETAASGG
ncbi:phosphoribosyltransferase [Salinispira pacifica]